MASREIIAVVRRSARPPPVSDCAAEVDANEVSLTDDTGSETLTQRHEFGRAFADHGAIADLVPADGNFRLCSQFTAPPTAAIRELAVAIAERRFSTVKRG